MINWLKKSAFASPKPDRAVAGFAKASPSAEALEDKMADKKENFAPLAIFILAVLPFVFNLRGFFVSDDWDFLTQVANPHQPLWRYFFTNYVGTHAGGSYRPLVVWFWAAAYHFFQLNYFWYHLVQIFFHAANAVLLYFIVLNFFQPEKKQERFILAAIAAVIFAILPNHSEAVAWIAAVNDPLCAFFYLASLLSLLLCLKFAKAKYWLYAASLLFFSAAIFTKEMAMSLPFIVLIFAGYYFWQQRERAAKILIATPYFIILAGYFWLRYRAIGLFFGYYGETHLHLGLAKIAADCADIVIGFVLSDKARAVFSLWLNNNLVIISVIFSLLLVWLIYLTWKKKWAAWPWLIFLSLLVSLAPVASLGVNLTRTYFSEEGERYGYLPSIFFATIAAALIIARWKKIKHRLPCRIIFPIIICLLAVGLAGQLLIKNWRFAEAAAVAQKTLQGAVTEMRQGNYAGVLFFGLPDNFHGAPIFRNGWQEAIDFYLPKPPIILAPFNRTAYELNQKFFVTKINHSDYDYSGENKAKSILAKPEFISADYSTVLSDYVYEPAGSDDRYFGGSLAVYLSDKLAANPQVGLFFWNGEEWEIRN
ncbi:MAG: hypothetical protein PHO56_01795 [Patescibacteria group bacterium]|nr:hypothetical protein [Patescibacteria group bacterium]